MLTLFDAVDIKSEGKKIKKTKKKRRKSSSGKIVAMSRAPVGFRFNPTEEELISYYLKNKIMGRPLLELECGVLIEAQIYGPEATPWELFRADDENLPWQLVVNSSSGIVSDSEKILYVFTKLWNVGMNGGTKQKSRTAGCGTWHGHSAAKDVLDDNGKGRKIGSKRMFTFKSNKTTVGQWIMYEYTIDPAAHGIKNMGGMNCGDYVVCRIKRDDSRCSEAGRVVSRKRMEAPMLEQIESPADADNNSRFEKNKKLRTISSSIENHAETFSSIPASVKNQYESEEEVDCLTAVQEWNGGIMNNEEEGGSTSGLENPPEPEPLQVVDDDNADGYVPVFDDNPAASENSAFNHPNSSPDSWEWAEEILPPNLCQDSDAFLNHVMHWSPSR